MGIKIAANNFHDMECIVNMLEDLGYITARTAAKWDLPTPPRDLSLKKADYNEVKTQLGLFMGSKRYPYTQFYVEKL